MLFDSPQISIANSETRQGLVTIDKWGFFFVPPDIDEPIGSGILKPAPKRYRTKTGRVKVRKRLVDSSNSQAMEDLSGFQFQITRPDGTPVAAPFTSDPTGHALSEEIPAGEYLLTELPKGSFAPPPPQPFTLKSARIPLVVTNTVPPGTPGYQ